jgi:hypothetical protein
MKTTSKPYYVIPFDKKYFLHGASLLQNFKTLLTDVKGVYVLDFGLTKNQIMFIEKMGFPVIRLPPPLINSHPYKLKSNLVTFLRQGDILGKWIALFDADMILLKPPTSEIEKIIAEMEANREIIALCRDSGPANNIHCFTEIFPKTRKFKELLAGKNIDSPYLNIGFTLFSPHFNFYEFKYLADLMEGETCWEQNAINLMCLDAPHRLLDPEVWNLHGKELLNRFHGQSSTYLLHLTGTGDSVSVGESTLKTSSEQTNLYYRYARNTLVREIQDRTLEDFISNNEEGLTTLLKNDRASQDILATSLNSIQYKTVFTTLPVKK